MNWKRTTLVINLWIVGLLFTAQAFASSLAIMQGATNETSSQFVLLVPKDLSPQIRIVSSDHQKSFPLAWTKRVQDEGSDWDVVQLKVNQLRLGDSYRLQVFNQHGEKIDQREFEALDTHLLFPKIAVASCMMDWLHNSMAWEQMQSLSPDLILFLGDTTYVDVSSPKDLISRPDPKDLNHWKRFVETRNTLDVFRWKKLKPILALADDHDFGYNDSDSSFPLRLRANFVFETFFGQGGEDFIFERGPGNSFKADLFGTSFVFLDGRNFRTLERIFSFEQIDWLKALQLKEQSFLLTGSQFFGAYLNKDSFEGNYPEAFQIFLNELQNFSTRFTFMSGDIHFSEVMKIEKENLGYETHEITSSSIHSLTVPGGHAFRPKNPRRIPSLVTSTHNFLTLEWDSYKLNQFTVRSHGWRGQDLFEGTLNFPGRNEAASCESLLLP